MRFLLFSILTFTLQIAISQNCDSELCITILNLKKQIRSEQLRSWELEKKLSELGRTLSMLKQNKSADQSSTTSISNEITLLGERLVVVTLKVDELKDELERAIKKLESYKDKSAEEQLFLDNLKDEMSAQRFMDEAKDGVIQGLYSDIHKFVYYSSYLHNVELGSGSRKDMTVIKRYRKGREQFVVRGFRELDLLNYSGDIYVPTEKPLSTTKGKLLLYADNRLHETVDVDAIEINDGFITVKHYVVDGSAVKLSNPFPEESKLRVGYVDNDTYYKYKAYFERFWDANSQGLFLITNLRPETLTAMKSDDLMNNCLIKFADKITVKSSYVFISIRDFKDIDGDIAAIYVNGVKVVEQELFSSYSSAKPVYLNDGINRLTLIPISEGGAGLCTVDILVHEPNKEPIKFQLKGTKSQTECIEIEKSK